MNGPTAQHNFEEAEDLWAPVIGHFILEFATVEDFLHSVISWYLRDTHVTESDLREGMPGRLSLFKKILSGMVETQQDRVKLETSVKGVKNLVQTRNLLAHNSLSLEMEETHDGTIRAIGPVIAGRRDPATTITLGALRLKLSELKRHRNDIADLLVIFHAHKLR